MALAVTGKKKPRLGGRGINGIAANNKGETMMKHAYISKELTSKQTNSPVFP
jgi:hypothetical protein